MGIIKAAIGSVGGGLADQWLEVIEPGKMSGSTVMTKGVVARNDKRSSNKKGTSDVITDGSVIHVYPNMMMLLMDGGKIIDYTAEEGYYTVSNNSAPSMFNGNLRNSIDESFKRFKFGGTTPQKQTVYYINLQEIKGIKFGTPNPLNYFDNFYNAELFLRAHGTYSIRITDPILFFNEVIPRDKTQVEIDDVNLQYLSEFLTAFQTTINQLSANGERISYVPSKSMEVSKVMSTILDEEWRSNRGMEVVSVAVASISYTEDSQELINMRNKGAMLGDAQIREGFVQGAIASGLENAGKNPNGSANAFMGMNLGMNAGGNFMQAASNTNAQQIQQNQASQQQATPKQQPSQEIWVCPNCATENTGKFCSECGTSKPTNEVWVCPNCAAKNTGKFCSECGTQKP